MCFYSFVDLHIQIKILVLFLLKTVLYLMVLPEVGIKVKRVLNINKCIGNMIVTVKSGKMGWSQVTVRRATGTSVWVMRMQTNAFNDV